LYVIFGEDDVALNKPSLNQKQILDSVKKFPLSQDKIDNNTIYHNIAIITKH